MANGSEKGRTQDHEEKSNLHIRNLNKRASKTNSRPRDPNSCCVGFMQPGEPGCAPYPFPPPLANRKSELQQTSHQYNHTPHGICTAPRPFRSCCKFWVAGAAVRQCNVEAKPDLLTLSTLPRLTLARIAFTTPGKHLN